MPEKRGKGLRMRPCRAANRLNKPTKHHNSWVDAFGEPNIVPLDAGLDPFEIYRRISPKYSRSFLFESLTESAEMAETTVMGFEPTAVIRGYRDRIDVQGPDGAVSRFTEDPLGALRDTMRTACHDAHRYAGGAVGIVNYEAVTLAEDIPQSHDSPGPLFEFGLYDDGILADRRTGDVSYFWYDTDRSPILKGLCAAPPSGPEEPFHATTPESPTGMAEFARMVERARKYIYDGDIFQVVLSRRFNFEASGNPLALYSKLRQLNPSPYMFHLKQGDSTAIGASPEMLVRITGKIAETFPIAGTRPIGSTPALTERLAAELASDVKELAEHTMLVDLGRNDMGRVCRHGTVKPLSLMEVKRFSHVQHLVTHITGRLSDDKDMFDAFRGRVSCGHRLGRPQGQGNGDNRRVGAARPGPVRGGGRVLFV